MNFVKATALNYKTIFINLNMVCMMVRESNPEHTKIYGPSGDESDYVTVFETPERLLGTDLISKLDKVVSDDV